MIAEKNMMRSAICVLIISIAPSFFLNAIGREPAAKEDPYIPVSLCDLQSNPDKYNGKKIAVRTSYMYNWEWVILFGSECSNNHMVCPVFNHEYPYNKKIFEGKEQTSGMHTATMYGLFLSTGPRLCPQCTTLKVMDIKDHILVHPRDGFEKLERLSKKEQKLVCKGDEMPNESRRHK
jgi:hypothetical protein